MKRIRPVAARRRGAGWRRSTGDCLPCTPRTTGASTPRKWSACCSPPTVTRRSGRRPGGLGAALRPAHRRHRGPHRRRAADPRPDGAEPHPADALVFLDGARRTLERCPGRGQRDRAAAAAGGRADRIPHPAGGGEQHHRAPALGGQREPRAGRPADGGRRPRGHVARVPAATAAGRLGALATAIGQIAAGAIPAFAGYADPAVAFTVLLSCTTAVALLLSPGPDRGLALLTRSGTALVGAGALILGGFSVGRQCGSALWTTGRCPGSTTSAARWPACPPTCSSPRS